ncbi:MAG: c-type cytochrome biogenesis protein CcsB [delta proteobacterium MLS_D]|jgi:cytochrome c-type biogenesis protein CcsB|nr:MAG: c-type cytochrome biogenesis protein CcsB [delta proteobacterium MLS_D]
MLLCVAFKKESLEKGTLSLAVIGLAVHTVSIAWRWILSYRMGVGHAPLANFYESLVFFSWSIMFVYLIARRRYANVFIGIISVFFAFIILAYASLSGGVDAAIKPLIPALKSNWLISHVVSSFLAYACFTLAFGSSILYLVKIRFRPVILPDAAMLDDITYRMISVGFIMLTLGIITGAVWADTAWGRYWGWDPKETWSFITWLIYGAFLHVHLARGWRGTKLSLISIIGFTAVLFTYLGVNYLLAGLHSYL